MATMRELMAIERRFRELVADAGVLPPDRIEYGADEVTFLWDEPKLAVVVEADGTAAA
jgi:hypothetical protein